MEASGPAERFPKPELDKNSPALLFLYAKDKQRWLRRQSPSESRFAEGVDHLVDELERYVTHNFDSMPVVDIVSSDIHTTLNIDGEGNRHVIESGPVPLEGDAALLGEHAVRATLYGFHRGQNHDLRMYASSEEDTRYLMGGVYTPLLSVGIEKSEIKLAGYREEERLEELSVFIFEHLDEYNDTARRLVVEFSTKLKDHSSAIARINSVSPIIAELAQHTNTMPQFIDALLDIIFLKLGLNIPHDFQVSSHRVVLSDQPIAAYRPQHGPTIFKNIVPQLGLIGETGSKGLGLFFMGDKSAIQIPVQYITNMNISRG